MENQSRNYEQWWDLPAILTMLVMLMLVNARLVSTEWTAHLSVIRLITFLGLVAGLALGYSHFSSKIVPIFAIVFGSFSITWLIGLTIGNDMLWSDRLYSMWIRLLLTINFLAQRKPVPDNLLFLFLMGILFWIIAVHSGFSLLRKAEPWRVIIPSGVALVVIHSYDLYYSRRILYLITYLFLSLIFVTRLLFLHKKENWKSNHTYLPPHLGMDILRIAVIGIIALLLVAWMVPTYNNTWQSAVNIWVDIKKPFQGIRDSFDNAFASLKSSVGLVNDYYRESMNLGLGNRLSDNELFAVLAPSEPPRGKMYYWRVRVYDQYIDGKWSTTQNINRLISPEDQEILIPTYGNRTAESFSFFFTLFQPVSLLYSPSPPEWISHPVKAEVVLLEDGTIDIGSIRAVPYLRSGDAYSVRSSLSTITKLLMRNSGSDYPKWIADRYLQLPEMITPRVRQLAFDLTKDQENPYDKVQVITDYLRKNIEYVEIIPELPTDEERIDWFLFEYKKGFCNYYASAEVIMLRSIGIPARLVVGYAQGETTGVNDTFLVRQRDAHAWPEVFFSDLGWIEFEPTSSQPELLFPSGEPLSNEFIQPIEKNEEYNPEEKRPNNSAQLNPDLISNKQNNFAILLLVVLVISLIFLIAQNILRKQCYIKIPSLPILMINILKRLGIQAPSLLTEWAIMSNLPEVSKAFFEINYALKRLKEKSPSSNTPIERANLLGKIIPELNSPSQILVEEYNLTVYSPQKSGNSTKAKKAGNTIRNRSIRRWFRNIFIK